MDRGGGGTRSPIRKVVVASFIGTTIEWSDYFIFATVYGTQASFYAELFGTRVRYSEASFSLQIPGIFGGALAPIIAATLFPTGGTTLISLYIAALCLLSIVCYFLAEETSRKDIYADEPEERKLVAGQRV